MVTFVLRNGGKVSVRGHDADRFAERISVRCNYDRPKVDGVVVGEYQCASGDVSIVIGDEDSMVSDKTAAAYPDLDARIAAYAKLGGFRDGE